MFCLNTYTCSAYERQKRLWILWNWSYRCQHMGANNWTQVLWKSHLSNPMQRQC